MITEKTDDKTETVDEEDLLCQRLEKLEEDYAGWRVLFSSTHFCLVARRRATSERVELALVAWTSGDTCWKGLFCWSVKREQAEVRTRLLLDLARALADTSSAGWGYVYYVGSRIEIKDKQTNEIQTIIKDPDHPRLRACERRVEKALEKLRPFSLPVDPMDDPLLDRLSEMAREE